MENNKILYIDMYSGLSGDMSLAGLASLGADLTEVESELSKLLSEEIKIKAKTVFVNGIAAKSLKLDFSDKQPFRKFSDIKKMISESSLPDVVKENSIKIFNEIAEAEAAVHGMPPEKVHFHEVGAVDSIIDIVGFCIGLHQLEITKVIASKPIIGHGMVKCQHGLIPVPAPATAKILEGLPIKRINVPSELTTPTGAGILKALSEDYTHEFDGKILMSGYSTGTKSFDNLPNILRLLVLKEEASTPEKIYEICTNIDDSRGETLGFLMKKLFEAKALDVSFAPIFMKKNRPAHKLEVLCSNSDKDEIVKVILKYSTAAGVRIAIKDRVIMNREIIETQYEGETARIKKLMLENITKYQPEWDDCETIAAKTGEPAEHIYHSLIASIKKTHT